MSNKLNEMRERLSKIDDIELLEVAKELLSEMAEIENLKQQIELREEKLIEGKRAAFYFFAMDLTPEELGHATNTAIGRIRFLSDKKERSADAEPDLRDHESVHIDTSSLPQSTFGGLGSSFKPK